MTDLINTIDITLSFNKDSIRIIGTHDNPYFVVSDICKVLGLSNVTNSMRNIPDKWKKDDFTNCKDVSGRTQSMLTVSEAGLYKLVMRSNKPVAEKFQEWVCEEVLPSIRKKGEYILEEYKQKLEDEKKKTDEQQKQLEEEKKKSDEQQKQLEEEKKKSEEKTKHIKKLENKYVTKQSRTKYEGKYVIYLLTSEKHDRTYIVGKATNLSDRLTSYNKSIEHDVAYYKACKSKAHMFVIELIVLYKLDKYRERANRDRFVLPEDKDISLFTNMVDYAISIFDDVDKDVDISKDEEMLKEEKHEYRVEYRKENIEKIHEQSKEYYQNNKEKIEKYRADHIEERVAYDKKHYEENREKKIVQAKEYRENNSDKCKEQHKKRYEENKEEILGKQKEYYEKNKQKVSERGKMEVVCECGVTLKKSAINLHRKSGKHKTLMKTKSQD
jgi:prophage antirepressor-like protein